MITGRDISDLADEIRKGTLAVDLDSVTVTPPNGDAITLPFPVEVTLGEDDLTCLIRVRDKSQVPLELLPMFEGHMGGTQIMGVETCYRISGSSPEGTMLELENVWPRAVQTNTTMGAGSTHHFHFNRINLLAKGWDAQNYDDIQRQLESVSTGLKPELSETKRKEPANEELFAILPGAELLIRPHGTTSETIHPFLGKTTSSKSNCFQGEILGGTFCLEERDGDLLVFYWREISLASDSLTARQIFSGILEAIGFTHGCQPWPFYLEHRCDYRVVERWVTKCRSSQRSALLPMSKARLHFESDAQQLFCKAAEFFARKDEKAKVFTRALWLLREGTRDGMPNEIRLITLCSLLEGLIHRLEDRFFTKDERKKIVRREKWKTIMERLSLPWDAAFSAVYESWDFYRHPLAHGFQEKTGDNVVSSMQAYSRMTAAIYILMAQEIGFRGTMERSVFEGNGEVDLSKQIRVQNTTPGAFQ